MFNQHCHCYPLLGERIPDIPLSAFSIRRIARLYRPSHYCSQVLAGGIASQFSTCPPSFLSIFSVYITFLSPRVTSQSVIISRLSSPLRRHHLPSSFTSLPS